MIIKSTKRIFNSDKIYRSYSDLNFGVTFLEHSVVRLLLTNILNPQKCLPDKFQNNRRLIRRLTTAVQCLQGFCSSMSSRQSVILLTELLFVTKRECILRTRSGSTTLHQYKEIRGTIVTAGKHFLTQSETFSCWLFISWSYCDCCQVQLLVLSTITTGWQSCREATLKKTALFSYFCVTLLCKVRL